MAPTFSATQQPPMTSQSQVRSAHAISNPTLAGIEKRWEAMPPQEQAELWMQLRDRMKVDWHEMTLQEKKAGMHNLILESACWELKMFHETTSTPVLRRRRLLFRRELTC